MGKRAQIFYDLLFDDGQKVRTTVRDPDLLSAKHERCACGHCRCGHSAGFGECLNCKCARYSWPGNGADLPTDHR